MPALLTCFACALCKLVPYHLNTERHFIFDYFVRFERSVLGARCRDQQ